MAITGNLYWRQPQAMRYQETIIIDERMGHVVGISQISKRANKYVTRKLWVIQGCTRTFL